MIAKGVITTNELRSQHSLDPCIYTLAIVLKNKTRRDLPSLTTVDLQELTDVGCIPQEKRIRV